jgi:hypothetical protein
MWWGLLLLGMALVGPITESIEKRWLNRQAKKYLGEMRSHKSAGHRWDTTRGQRQT